MRQGQHEIGSPKIDFQCQEDDLALITAPEGGMRAFVWDTDPEVDGYYVKYNPVTATWDEDGTGGGGGGHEIQEGGTPLDDEPALNFDADDFNLSDNAGISTDVEINESKWATKSYADSLVIGLWDDRGSFDASVNAYPSSGGSGTAGAILKGDIWTVSVAGTLPTGQVVEIGDVVRALVDTPGNTQANWAIQQNNIGYTAENSANKSSSIGGSETSTTIYPSVKGIVDWIVNNLMGFVSAKTTPVDADVVFIGNSADSNKTYKTTWANIKATLLSYFQGFFKTKLTADRTYYVRTDGNDSNDGLTNSSGGAFLTADHANDIVSQIDANGYNVTVKFGAGTWNEDIVLKSPVGVAVYKWEGTLTLDETATSATVAAGSGGTAGTVTKTGQFTSDTHTQKLAYFATDDEYRVIYSNTANALTLADIAPSSTTQDVSVYSFGTIIDSIQVPTGVSVVLEFLKLNNNSSENGFSLEVDPSSSTTPSNCWFGKTFVNQSSIKRASDCIFWGDVSGAIVAIAYSGTAIFDRCLGIGKHTSAQIVVVSRGGYFLFNGGTYDGDDGAGAKATYGIRVWGSASAQLGTSGSGTPKIRNCDTGLRSENQSGFFSGTSASFTNCTTSTSADATTYATMT